MAAKGTAPEGSVYARLIERIFLDRWKKGAKEVPFGREDIEKTAKALKLKLPKNLGDVIYSVRYRTALPAAIASAAPEGMTWEIEGRGTGLYTFRLTRVSRILPNQSLASIKIPDATPQIVVRYAQGDEQALLARLRYNRLIDVFLGVAAYSLQNHLRSNVKSIGQIEIDELYVGVDKQGRQFVLPVQAKGGSDELSAVQARQDMKYCKERFPQLVCRAIAAQFAGTDLIALFELTLDDDEVRVAEEKHYKLVPSSSITEADLAGYGRSS